MMVYISLLTLDTIIFIDSQNKANVFNYNTKTIETLNFSKYFETDMSYIFTKQQLNKKESLDSSLSLKEKIVIELADPNKQPIFDICYNRIEKNLFISGIDFLKSFKIFNYQY